MELKKSIKDLMLNLCQDFYFFSNCPRGIMGMSLLSYLILHQNNVGILLLFQIPESIDILFTVNGQV